MACELKAVFGNNISPPNSMKRRGYKYDSPEKLISSKEDKDLIIPEFSTIFEGTTMTKEDVRRKVADWMYEVSLTDKFFAKDPITTFCLGVELFDKVMLSIEKLNVRWVQLMGIVCLWIAGKVHLDHFEVDVNAADIAKFTDDIYSKKDVLIAEFLILERVEWCVSSKYTVPWFVDYLNGFETKKKFVLFDKLAECHISGQYRLNDPYTCAVKLLSSM